MNREIRKKVWPEYFEKILKEEKKFEIRLADFDVEKGDILILEEFNPISKQHTGRSIKRKVTYISSTKKMEEMHSKKEIDEYGFHIIQMEREWR